MGRRVGPRTSQGTNEENDESAWQPRPAFLTNEQARGPLLAVHVERQGSRGHVPLLFCSEYLAIHVHSIICLKWPGSPGGPQRFARCGGQGRGGLGQLRQDGAQLLLQPAMQEAFVQLVTPLVRNSPFAGRNNVNNLAVP